MAGLKRNEPALMFGGAQVTPDEIDQYTVYQVVNPGTSAAWFGAPAAGSLSGVKAIVITNAISDYPRNLLVTVAATGSVTAIAGTATVNGKDQFGSVISETIVASAAAATATGQGTKVFAQITSGTYSYGTNSVAGTATIGFSTGTSTLFGLPVKIAGTKDVVLLSHNAGTGVVTVNGGTIGAYVNATMHAIQPAATLTGTEAITVWVESNYNPTNIAEVSALRQI